ncbi:MAG: acetoacetate--CoA ligase, partial [Rhodobiaceae bacterium]|nr:acetoacetate--CoA ligase [Rhodobiaceae bacterium]
VVLFVILADGEALTEELIATIRKNVRSGASSRHGPAKVIAVTDIPRTKSGKITELAVRDIIEGRGVKNREALANPEALELYRDLEELEN